MTEDEFHRLLCKVATTAYDQALVENDERRAIYRKEEDARAAALAEFRRLTAENARLREALESVREFALEEDRTHLHRLSQIIHEFYAVQNWLRAANARELADS